MALERPNRLWTADLTYVAIPGGFVYLAAILDAWSGKVVGYVISRSIVGGIAAAAHRTFQAVFVKQRTIRLERILGPAIGMVDAVFGWLAAPDGRL